MSPSNFLTHHGLKFPAIQTRPLVPANLRHQSGDHGNLRDPGLSHFIPAGDAAPALFQLADDICVAAVLDLAAGAHHGLDRHAAKPGCLERSVRLLWHGG